MPLESSADFGAQAFDQSGQLQIHSHLFPSANTALAHLRGAQEIVQAHQDFLKGVMRVDIFGVKQDGSINGELTAPLRPAVPTLEAGKKYLLETVIRTLKMGHLFTEGTPDSNEIWMDVTVTSGDRVIGRSGDRDSNGEVDRWAHFVNVFMLDRNGSRVNRRNAQDIFVPLYNHQIPPGAAQVVHYGLDLPDDLTEPVTVEVKLQFRKFDREYMDYVARSLQRDEDPLPGYKPGEPYKNDLPITTLATDTITFPVAKGADEIRNRTPDIPVWQRWNDYGIGLLLEGRNGGKGELRQAAEAFEQVERRQQYHGPLNLARVYFTEGRLDEAVVAAQRAAEYPDAPTWTINWLSGVINKQQGYLEKAITNLRAVLEDKTPEMIRRKFDFSRDYEVINELGQTLFERAKQFRGERRRAEREKLLREAVAQFEKTLQIDSENVAAHFNLAQLYALLNERERAAKHQALHARYKPDDNARDRAIALARQRYPSANRAAEPLVIYSLHRTAATGLSGEAIKTTAANPPPTSSHGG
jgi:tetratricopeptide (TPR) repeat protein